LDLPLSCLFRVVTVINVTVIIANSTFEPMIASGGSCLCSFFEKLQERYAVSKLTVAGLGPFF
jgi:hypothetical protein